MTQKTDFKKALAGYQARRGQFQVLQVPPMQYLMIDGAGDPNTAPVFTQSIETLYPVAYTLKFTSKTELGRDYVAPPLEGLWWAEQMSAFTTARDKSRWQWTLMLMVPDWIGADMVTVALATVAAKRPPPRIEEIRFQFLGEGQCVQTLHIGSFDDEATVLAELHQDFLPGNRLQPAGHHHEIYLSDFRRVPAPRRRTILGQPVIPAGTDS